MTPRRHELAVTPTNAQLAVDQLEGALLAEPIPTERVRGASREVQVSTPSGSGMWRPTAGFQVATDVRFGSGTRPFFLAPVPMAECMPTGLQAGPGATTPQETSCSHP